MSFLDSESDTEDYPQEDDVSNNLGVGTESEEDIPTNLLTNNLREIKLNDTLFAVTDFNALSPDQQIMALEEINENMICYVIKSTNKNLGCYVYTYQTYLENMCDRGLLSYNKMKALINIIQQINNTAIPVHSKIQLIHEYTGHSISKISEAVLRIWDPTKIDRYDPTRIGCMSKLYYPTLTP
jgi:hypothetical protein